MAPKHSERPVLALNTGHIRQAIINSTSTRDHLRLHAPPRDMNRPWLTSSDEMRHQQELLYTFKTSAPINNSWDNAEHYVHDKDIQMVLYLQDFPVDRWMLPIEEALATVDGFLERESIRGQGRSIFEGQRCRSAVVDSRIARISGLAPSGGALRSSRVTTASVSTTFGVTTGAPILSPTSRARVSLLSAGAPVVASRISQVPRGPAGVRSSRSLDTAAATATNASPGAIVASRSADASTSTLPAPPVVSQSGASVTSAPLALDGGLYSTNPVPDILQSRVNDNKNKRAVDPSDFPWLQVRSSGDSGQWTDDIYTKSRLRSLEAVHRGNEPRARELEKDENKKGGDTKDRSCLLQFVNDATKKRCERLPGFTKIDDAIKNAAGEAHNPASLATITIYYGSEKTSDIRHHEFSLMDAVRTQKFLNQNNILSREAALRIIDFCPHLLYGNVLLRVMAEASLSQSKIRHRLLLNGAVFSQSTLSTRMRTALGHVWVRGMGDKDSPEHKVAKAWEDINTANFAKYKKRFLEGADEAGASTAVVAETLRVAVSSAGKATSRKRVREKDIIAPDPKRAKTRSQTMNEAIG